MARRDNRIRIGIYGGTFNPVHYGHLINIESIREHFSLDKVLFVPAKDPVHKTMTDYASPEDRLAMIQLAIAGNSFFEATDTEISRETPSYTIYTIESAEKEYRNADLFLIIGSDSFNELDTWKSYEEIIRRIPIIIMMRPGSDFLREDILSLSDMFSFYENPLIDISSTVIRERVRQGRSVRYMTADAVIEYIHSKGLYKIE